MTSVGSSNDDFVAEKMLSKEKLYKKYIYLPKHLRESDAKNSNIYKMMENLHNKFSRGLLEDIDMHVRRVKSKCDELHDLKLSVMKEMIMNNKLIPEKWIALQDYKQLLTEALSDPEVLNYAVFCKEIHKKRAGQEFATDDEKYEYLKSINKTSPNYAFGYRPDLGGKKMSKISSYDIRLAYSL